MTHYDLVIVGAGSGNTILDSRFTSWRVAIIEQGPFGGTCLNRGCIPSKMYLHPADVADDASSGPRLGVQTRFDGADWPAIRDRVFSRTDQIAADGKSYREGLDGVDVITGTARFSGARTLTVELADGTTDVTGDQIVLATGTRPVVPDVPGLDQVGYFTSDDIMRLDDLPARVGILGGGYVGSEFAHIFAGLGSSVVQVDAVDTLLGNQDADIREAFTKAAGKRWDVRLNAGLERVESSESMGRTTITMHLGDGSSAEVDVLLIAVGRQPNSDLLDLKRAGVETDDQGRIQVDAQQRTSTEGIWALGDASTDVPLKHVANHEARVVKTNLLRLKAGDHDLMGADHRFIPSAVFSSPQVAAVGLAEKQAREQGIDLAIARHKYADVAHGWALGDDEAEHFVKVLGDRSTGQLVGAHIIGPEASLLIQPLIQAMSFGQPVAGLARDQYWIHPALTEVVENALIKLAREMR